MAPREVDLSDAPACPLLGLADDPRTRFTFPHPGHRCHALRSPNSIDATRQVTWCLVPAFFGCDRYTVFHERAEQEREKASKRPVEAPAARPSVPPAAAYGTPTAAGASAAAAPPAPKAASGSPTAAPARPTATPVESTAAPARPTAAAGPPNVVIHVVRAGDSLERIAAAYGLTAGQIAAANGLASPADVTDGQRLVIPLRRRDPGASGQRSRQGSG